MGERKFCYNCMETYEAQRTVCPYCNYDENSLHDTMYIAPGTILHDRYLVGVLLRYNGEGATYIGYDKVISCKVLLREYMPINLCTRVKDKPTISVNYNNLAKYKAFMAEYTELNKSLARLRNNTNINPILDMFAENNTTYTVFEFIEGMSLLEYLKNNAGELNWEHVAKLFPPLFTTIGILHNAGITHRAISPETVYITDKGELKLSGFCISAIRTANAGLEYELFKGYAAPEQYSASSSSRQGSWTDVYSVCALIYRMLTGCMPTDSLSRLECDDLCEPHMLNKNVPVNISRIIMEGMNLSGRDRIQTITELVTKLFEQPAAPVKPLYPTGSAPTPQVNNARGYNGGVYNNTSNYQQNQIPPQPEYNDDDYYDDYDNNDVNNYDDNVDDYEENYHYEKVNTVDRLKVPIIIGVLFFAILMIIAVVLLNLFSKNSDGDSLNGFASSSIADNIVTGTTEPTTETTSENTDSIMFDLKGKYIEITQEKYAEYFTLNPIYEYNDEYDKDQIFEQEIAAGSPFTKGDTITVKVSKGKATAIIPDYKDCTVSQYESALKQAGITNYSLIEENSSSSGTPNTITSLQIDGKTVNAGESFNNAEGSKLIVYYLSKNAVVSTTAPTTQAATEAPTTTPPTTQAPTEAPTEAQTEAPTEAQTQDSEQTPEYGDNN